MSYMFHRVQKAVLIVKAAGLVPCAIENNQRILDVRGTTLMLLGQETSEVLCFRTGPHQQRVWLSYNRLQHWESKSHIRTCTAIRPIQINSYKEISY